MTIDVFIELSPKAKSFSDDRGFLDVLYEDSNTILKRSFSKAGVFRGMHWQRPPNAQTKLIRVISGRIYDFVINPIEDSKIIYWREITKSDGWIEVASKWAHGFYAIEDTEFEYFCIGAYNEQVEDSFSIIDFLVDEMSLPMPFLSSKDASAKPLKIDKSILCKPLNESLR